MSLDSSVIRLSSPFKIAQSSLREANRTTRRNPLSLSFSPSPSTSSASRNNSNKKPPKLGVGAGARRGAAFDGAAYEAERLRLDAEARESKAEASEGEGSGDPKAWKWAIRKEVWDSMEARNVAQNPRPVHHRMTWALWQLSELKIFRVAECVKVNPDSPQKQVRFLTLSEGKKLLTPQPRLKTGSFSVLQSSMLAPHSVNEACTSAGVAKYGRPIGLDEKIKVDLIVIGSVAVDPNTGARLGKGEGFAELEYGLLRYMGAIDDSTPVVTSGTLLIHG